MIATVLDTVTGETQVRDDVRSWEWHCNNWSCDCNREFLFGRNTSNGICSGGKRYIVIKAVMDSPDDYEYTLHELNSGYPEELLTKHGVTLDVR